MSRIQIQVKRPHKGQSEVLDSCARYNVLNIGRRWGKSSLAVNKLIIEPPLQGHPVAYYTPTYKDLDEIWQEVKHILSPVISRKNEQTKQIRLVGGGIIDFWSLENPDSGRGRKYKRVVVDEVEKAKKFEQAWKGAIMPTLLDLQGDAWLLSTPKFGDTFFKKLWKRGGSNGWASYNLSTYDNPHMDRDEIDNLRLQMDDLSFRCEILAEDVDIALYPFAYAFDPAKHVKPVTLDPYECVVLSFDFNVDPITCLAIQHVAGEVRVLKEFALPNSDIHALCDMIRAAYPNSPLMVTGDATGQARSALTQGNVNYYDVVQGKLNLGDLQMRQPRSNPSVRDTRVLMNSMLQNTAVFIDPGCELFIRDMKYVEVDQDGDIIKDRKSDVRKSDLMDCFRYYLYTFHQQYLNFFY